MKLLNNRAMREVEDRIISNHPKIEVKEGLCRLNYRCHMNSVHDAIKNNEKEIAMVVYFDEDRDPIIHFLNVSKQGKYTDNTLGVWAGQNDYYLIKKIGQSEFFRIGKIFTSYRKDLKKNLKFITRLFSNFEA